MINFVKKDKNKGCLKLINRNFKLINPEIKNNIKHNLNIIKYIKFCRFKLRNIKYKILKLVSLWWLTIIYNINLKLNSSYRRIPAMLNPNFDRTSTRHPIVRPPMVIHIGLWLGYQLFEMIPPPKFSLWEFFWTPRPQDALPLLLAFLSLPFFSPCLP